MLLALRLKNLAIIDQLELNFAPGLNVISGETGAGKSIIVGALSLLLGAKASADLIRAGCEEAEVEALFDATGAELPDGLDIASSSLGEAAEVSIRRALSAKGRSRTWLNLRLCPAPVAAEVCAHLVAFCGQHEHQALLNNPALQLDIVDRAGGLLELRASVAAAFAALTEARRGLEAARKSAATAAERAELLGFQAAEIEAAQLKVGEEEELEAERRVLRSAEKLLAEAGEAYQLLDGEDSSGGDSAVSRLGVARRKIEDLSRLDGRLGSVLAVLEPALFQAQEAAGLLRGYVEGIEPDPARLEWVEERLGAIRGLKRKYGASVAEVVAFGERARAELAAFEQAGERLATLEAEVSRRREGCGGLSRELTGKRQGAAEALSARLTAELRQVGMPEASFAVRLLPRQAHHSQAHQSQTHQSQTLQSMEAEGATRADGDPLGYEGLKLSPRGLEEAEFLVAPNPGEGFKPLSRTASGGELSRLVLGLKTVLSGGTDTLVFDEVDAGLGGAVAEVVGRKLKALSANQQIVCITHLPQIACFAQAHFRVAKEVEGGRTLARVAELTEAERLEEVARMLGGVRVTDKARQHAREMIRGASA